MYTLIDRTLKITMDTKKEITVEIPEHINIYKSEVEIPFDNIKFSGENNTAVVGDNVNLENVNISLKGNGNIIVIGSNTVLRGLIQIKNNNSIVYIGANTTFNHVRIYCKGEGNQVVYIGKDCMFSSGIEIRTCDAHSIIDLTTKTKINRDQDVYIGNHTWVGKNSLIQKGAYISEDTVIGFGSFVNKKFNQGGQIIAGSPARLVKYNTTWSRYMKTKQAVNDVHSWKDLPEI